MRQNLLLTSLSIFNILGFLRADYIHKEINGDISRSFSINYTVILYDSTGVMLFALDAETLLLITIEENHGVKTIVLRTNNFFLAADMKDICKTNHCFRGFVKLSLTMNPKHFIVNCFNNTYAFDLDRAKRHTNYKDCFKTPNTTKNPNRIFLNIGNINPDFINQNFSCDHSQNQLIGCLDSFSFGNQAVSFETSGAYFSKRCEVNSLENTRGIEYCVGQKSVHDFKCVLKNIGQSLFNAFDVKPHNNKTYSFPNYKPSSAKFELLWKPSSIGNFCLLEIEMRNQSVLSFYIIDSFVFLRMMSKEINSLHKVYQDKIHMIKLWHLNNSNLMIEISAANHWTQCSIISSAEMRSINVGFTKTGQLCQPFRGETNFQYHFKPLESSYKIWKIFDLPVIIIISMFLTILFLICLVRIGFWIWKGRPQKEKINIYEEFNSIGVRMSMIQRDIDVYETID